MISFSHKIVQFGFGAVGKSFFEKVSQAISFPEQNYFVITANQEEFTAFVNLGGITSNFIVTEITRDNYQEIFGSYLTEGDLLIDFADTVGTRDICEWCIKEKVMYLNTGETDWPDNWYSILKENQRKKDLQKKYAGKISAPIILEHGNNPGLVSHFVKAGLSYIVKKQFPRNKKMKNYIKKGEWNQLAYALKLRMVHVNDIDNQEIKEEYTKDKLISTWSPDSFFFEILSEATEILGTHEAIKEPKQFRIIDNKTGFVEYKEIAFDKKCKTYYPGEWFEGYLVPHEETITIADTLTIQEKEEVLYRPTVKFIYRPCNLSRTYLEKSRVNTYPDIDPNKPLDKEEKDCVITRGFLYPKETEIVYPEKIRAGTEYVGVLLIGEDFDPVWVGNRVELSYLKKQKNSYWQTPTITPVAMSALAAVCWMIKHPNKGNIYFPDNLPDYQKIIKFAEKFISKTIYKTFKKEELRTSISINNEKLETADFFIKEKE